MQPIALYDAFTSVPFAGSQAAVVLQAEALSSHTRAQLARELGVPATAFVDSVSGNRVVVQFYSTVMQLPMCGHGTICLVTRLVETGLLPACSQAWQQAILDLPRGEAEVVYRHNSDGHVEVMLDVSISRFSRAELDLLELARVLGVESTDFATHTPLEIAAADFTHLCLPMRDLAAITRLRPDFSALAAFCRAHKLDTVASFSTEVEGTGRDLHVRDFCPAVGVDESAAAGTSNAALAAYLYRNGLVNTDSNHATVVAEQGIELGRPSKVTSLLTTARQQITRLQVGGVACRLFEGSLDERLVHA